MSYTFENLENIYNIVLKFQLNILSKVLERLKIIYNHL